MWSSSAICGQVMDRFLVRLEPPGSETDSESQPVPKRHCTSKETDTTAASKLTHSKSAMYKNRLQYRPDWKEKWFWIDYD